MMMGIFVPWDPVLEVPTQDLQVPDLQGGIGRGKRKPSPASFLS